MTKCRKLVGRFKHSPLQSGRLSEAAQELQLSNLCLIQDVTTRWFSVLAMAQRLVSQIEAVNQLVEADIRLSDLEITRLQHLVKVLDPLKDISDRLGGEHYVTGSVVVHATRKLETYLIPTIDDPMYISAFKKAFSSYLDANIRLPPLLKTCAVLDPRFKRPKGQLFNYFIHYAMFLLFH